MQQVKVFYSYDKPKVLEKEINEWLSNHSSVGVEGIKWSVSESDNEDWSTSFYSALIIYTTKERHS